MTVQLHREEVRSGKRFEFGKNWNRFLATLNEDKIRCSIAHLQKMLGADDLTGLTFLDIGSGSGLSSLVARRLGASVHSFDFDPQSVECTRVLRDRHFPGDRHWIVEQGSALDDAYLSSLNKFDIVFSWGVLHHTGDMWTALKNSLIPLNDDGFLVVAIYNYQFPWTAVHTVLKKLYNSAPTLGKWPILGVYAAMTIASGAAADLVSRKNPLSRYFGSKRVRGMNWWHDVVDWAGGYPFETAQPEEIFEFFAERGCRLQKLVTCGGKHGCNQFAFIKETQGTHTGNVVTARTRVVDRSTQKLSA